MTNTTAGESIIKQCPHCGYYHGPRCPYVRAVDYYPNGAVKRVEYISPGFEMPPTFNHVLPRSSTWSTEIEEFSP